MEDGKGPFNSFVAFSSHFWICMMKAKGFAEDDIVYFPLPVDCRRRINPPLPHAYFGNCVHGALARTTAGKLFSEGISFGAGVIVEAIKSLTDKSIKDYMNFIETTGQSEYPVDKNVVMHFVNGQFTVMTQSAGTMPVYEELDFGWGRPISVRSVRPIFSRGTVVVFRGPEGGSGIEASVALPANEMQRLQSLLFSFGGLEL